MISSICSLATLHLQPADLLKKLSLLGLPVLLVLGLHALGEHLADSVQKLPLPLAHLDRVVGVIGSDLLDRLPPTDRLQGDSSLKLGTMGARLLIGESHFQGRYPASEVNDGTVQKSQTTST